MMVVAKLPSITQVYQVPIYTRGRCRGDGKYRFNVVAEDINARQGFEPSNSSEYHHTSVFYHVTVYYIILVIDY